MRHEATRDLFRYWNRVRGGRASPERDQIDPTAIRDVLAETFLLETRADGTFPIRLSGTRLDALWLHDLKDRCFLDLWGEDRHSVAAALWTVMDGTAPVVLSAATCPSGRAETRVESLLLPLRHNGRTHSLVLGTLSLNTSPPWIGLVPVERLRLISMRVLTPNEEVDLPVMRRISIDATMPPPKRRAHLTIYAGGR